MRETAPLSPFHLQSQAQFLKGVGPRRADLLRRLGLITARDVLYHIPHRYEDASTVHPIGKLEPGMEATIIGRVVSSGVLPTRKGLRIFQAVVKDATGVIECSWPGQPFLDRIIRKGDLLLLMGSVRFFHGRQFHPREYTLLSRQGEASPEEEGTLFPVYPATEGLSHRQVRKLISDNLDRLLEGAAQEELLDPELLRRLKLPTLVRALEMLHRPTTLAQAESGRRRLAFEELLFLQLVHARARHEMTIARPGIAFERRGHLVRLLFENLPFQLTGAQKRVLAEISEDMSSRRRMNRLLQGDVGSGKTVVALFAMLRAVENGRQAALMAPTEILAEQHQRTLARLLEGIPVRIQILTGRMRASDRRRAVESIASGEAQIVVGTHALIQEAVSFGDLGLGVIDEQHRFGVRQRLALAESGKNPDVLVMSATPIPRSLALTLHGDLDVSILDERPPGRPTVKTVQRPPSGAARVFEFVREQVQTGRQAYIVYPLVEDSETLDLGSATEAFKQFGSEVFAGFRLGLIHGQMPAEEKDRVMRAFSAGEIDILVSTTVIEVGIDVANATVMVVEHAERFGLSQLHQLRGRVGRGAEGSFCILLAPPEAAERLAVFTATDDGFEIARADLRLRGQGDLFGDRQSGIPAFRFADLEKDEDLLTKAREEARSMIAEDPPLRGHPRIRSALAERYGDQGRMFQTG